MKPKTRYTIGQLTGLAQGASINGRYGALVEVTNLETGKKRLTAINDDKPITDYKVGNHTFRVVHQFHDGVWI